MKNLIISILLISIASTSLAQKKGIQISPEHYNKSIKVEFNRGVDEAINMNANTNHYVASKFTIQETHIGNTVYDLQTNSVHGERAYITPTGEMAAVWTQGFDNPGFSDRGTGYNYFDGTSWGGIPDTRLEADYRSGWPSIAMWGDGEVFTAHSNYDDATSEFDHLAIFTRLTRGSGDWTVNKKQSTIDGAEYLWNRLATSGDNNEIIHIISNTNNDALGQSVPVLYNRSTDGGATWGAEDVVLEGTGADYYSGFSADSYKIKTKGDIVCIFYVSSWHDLFYMRSEDNGQTWTKNVVWEHPYPLWDWDNSLTTDTIWAPDGSFDATIDNNGKVHMAFPITRVIHPEAGTAYNYFPWTDGIIYWNEDMDPFENPENQHYALKYENLTDEQYAGYTMDLDGDGELTLGEDIYSYPSKGLSTMPSIEVDEDNNILIAYVAHHELRDYSGDINYKYHQVFCVNKRQELWSTPFDLSYDFLHAWDEIIYPYIIGIDEDYIHMFVSIDNTPGLALNDEEQDYVDNKQVYWRVEEYYYSIKNSLDVIQSVSQNYPNPASDRTSIKVNIVNNSKARFELVNILGQKVFSINQEMVQGDNYFNLDVRNYSSGIYFYTIIIDNQKETRKMIIE